MKKVISLALTLAMVLTMSLGVFAAENPTIHEEDDTYTTTNDDIDVNATLVVPDDIIAHVYHVTLQWEQKGTITYTDKQMTYTWNPEGTDLKYDSAETTAAKWECSSDAAIEITVINKSDLGIKATCANPVVKNLVTSITGSYDVPGGVLDIASAAPAAGYKSGETGTAQQKTATFSITDVAGSISGANGSTHAIGTITVTIAAASAGEQG